MSINAGVEEGTDGGASNPVEVLLSRHTVRMNASGGIDYVLSCRLIALEDVGDIWLDLLVPPGASLLGSFSQVSRPLTGLKEGDVVHFQLAVAPKTDVPPPGAYECVVAALSEFPDRRSILGLEELLVVVGGAPRPLARNLDLRVAVTATPQGGTRIGQAGAFFQGVVERATEEGNRLRLHAVVAPDETFAVGIMSGTVAATDEGDALRILDNAIRRYGTATASLGFDVLEVRPYRR
jgi:hypothetical protein